MSTRRDSPKFCRRCGRRGHVVEDCPAPAVPVGVQPEPAEEAHPIRRSCGNTLKHEGHRWHAPAWCSGNMRPIPLSTVSVGEMLEGTDEEIELLPPPSRRSSLRGGPIHPAVPVVHPEPGDRDEKWMRTYWLKADPGDCVRALMALADAEVAAAVATVRADRDRLEAEVQELRHDWEQGAWRQVPATRHRQLLALAGQVAAIRALCDEQDAKHPLGTGHPCFSTDALRAALVASSPTTREVSR